MQIHPSLFSETSAVGAQNKAMRRYYQGHALFYNATRWSFLFGRRELINRLKIKHLSSDTLLEAGCGTGYNLKFLAHNYPNMHLIGVDVAPAMLQQARQALTPYRRRVLLEEMPYLPGVFEPRWKPAIVLFSYALTMFNPGWEAALEKAWDDLPPGGLIAVVDFHNAGPLFRQWMALNHVRMEGHLLPVLEKQFTPIYSSVRKAYGGLWTYFLFVGKKGL